MATLFRPRAIAGLSAADSLDRPVRIVRTPAWVALGLALILLAGLAVWLLVGTVAITATGSGVVNNVPTNSVVSAPSAGVLIQAAPPVGTPIKEGDVLSVIRVQDKPVLDMSVRSPVDGTVVSIGPGPHTTLEYSQYLATVAPATKEQVAYLFLPPEQGARLEAGLRVTLAPASVDTNADGLLEGRVTTISSLPVSESRIAYLTASPDLTGSLVSQGPLVEVQVALEPDPGTPTGWKWTQPPGPPEPLVSGTPTSGTVILTEVPPYAAFLGSA